MSLSIEDWHRRYAQQARWTKALRDYLFHQSGLDQAGRVLEAGSGTGVLLADLDSLPARAHGLDIDFQRLQHSSRYAPGALHTCGDAHQLPYSAHSFDGCFCHYLLLWVQEPAQVLAELVRVTHPGGAVLILAEPDYGGRIDYPEELEKLGEWQVAALRQQGAEPELGRRLAGLCADSGLVGVETGVLGGEWKVPNDPAEFNSEWTVYESDFESLGFGGEEKAALNRLREIDRAAWETGERVLFVPTFYAWGIVPG